MAQFKVLGSAVLLLASILVLAYILFAPRPIQIVLETGQEVATQNSDYFSLGSAIVLVMCSFLIGASITYLYYNAENGRLLSRAAASKQDAARSERHELELVMPLLREDEKKAVRALRDNKGEILQNELVLKLGFGKVKTTRILASLERKNIISKARHGMTNRIVLKV